MKTLGWWMSLIVLTLATVGCGPVKLEQLETVDTNEEAFLVSLETDAEQGHLGGLEVMESQSKAVTTQRVSLQQRKTTTGYAPWSYQWTPTQKLVTVNTSLVTREWTTEADTKTGQGFQAIEIESLDSIGISLASTISCSILRGEGAKFRYYFSGQKLEEVVDTEIHGYIQARAAEKFGAIELEKLNSIMDAKGAEILTEARAFFAPRGINIEFFGWIGGAKFTNPAIQEKVDELFVAENDQLVALQEKEVAEKNNLILISKAESQRDAAKTAYEAKDATLLRSNLQIRKYEAETVAALAEKFDGKLPRIIPAGSGLLFGIDKAPHSTELTGSPTEPVSASK